MLSQARSLATGDAAIALEIDRLDGQVLLRMGEWNSGEALLNTVVTRAAATADRYHQATALNDLGRGLMARSRFDEALPYFERVVAMQDLSEWSIYAASLNNAGSCYQRLGQFDRAVASQQRALDVQEHRGKRESFVQALGEMGNLYALRGEPDRALPYLQRGLDEAKAAGLTRRGGTPGRQSRQRRSRSAPMGRGRARQPGSAATLAGTIAKPSVYHVLRTARIALGRDRFDEGAACSTQVLASSGSPAGRAVGRALQSGPRGARAQAAGSGGRGIRSGPDDRRNDARRASEDGRQGLLSDPAHLCSIRTYVSALLAQGQTDRALEVADSSRGQLLAERQTDVGRPLGSKAAAFQRVARESGAVLLSYWLAPDQSWLWVIVSAAACSCCRCRRPRRSKRSFASISRRSPTRWSICCGARNTAGDKLYQTLVAPAAAWIPKDARVIIVPDGALHEINFETLIVDAPVRHYWIDDVQVEIAPSLATLTAAAGPVADGGKRLLLVGNPRAHEPEFPALTYAAAEMSNVAAHFATDAVTALDGERASPIAYREAQPDRFAYVHFTAHATANRDSPLDSVVVLSGPEDRFKLYVRDVAALRLHAELVTISACRSAGDRAYSGDGLVGFSWAFMKAGARHVIAGLWDVDDRATPQLMDRLYAGIAQGHGPGRALRDAKRAVMSAGGASAAPYRWAALQMFTASP